MSVCLSGTCLVTSVTEEDLETTKGETMYLCDKQTVDHEKEIVTETVSLILV